MKKIMSKMGISLLSSYQGAQLFEAIGIGGQLMQTAFKGTPSRIGGLTPTDLAEEIAEWHEKAFGSEEMIERMTSKLSLVRTLSPHNMETCSSACVREHDRGCAHIIVPHPWLPHHSRRRRPLLLALRCRCRRLRFCKILSKEGIPREYATDVADATRCP